MGGSSDAALRRTARIADGWFPQFRTDTPQAAEAMERLRGYIAEAGRRVSDVGIEGRATIANATPDEWGRDAERWAALGSTHLSVNTMGAGLASPRAHIEAIRRYWEVVTPLVEQAIRA
jgi:alkanesulfonate monooxygenase SsuD/methylene tetrahydromethanopterin reductase-like flavin-dependent oxidoreductase (luciferase family)